MIPVSGNPVAVVTGAGSGIGAGIARLLGKGGYAVALWDLQESAAGEVLADIEAAGGVGTAVAVDVSDHGSVLSGVERTVSAVGPIRALVNNAGVRDLIPFFDVSPADWQRVIDVDLTGVFFCTQAAAAVMREHGGGSVVNIASMAATISYPDRTAYVAAKAGVLGLTRSTAQSLAPHGIRVNAVSPGSIETPLHATNKGRPEIVSMIERTPLHRFGKPNDIAEAVAFLLADEAGFITGQELVVDGGRMAVG